MMRRLTLEQRRRQNRIADRESDRRLAAIDAEYRESQRQIQENFESWIEESRSTLTPIELAAIDAEHAEREARDDEKTTTT
jgi:hypothetical protein